jgi:soluble lytic murein transglycosylase-like protein
MNGRTIPLLLALLAPCQALADTAPIPGVPANAVCRQAIVAAERAHGIPSHLLAAIARVESGRRDPASRSFNPWPWTINMDGQGSFYDDKAQAVAAAVSMRPHVATSIDVGCMQISLIFHPDAFPDMGRAFDPASNADYGARFLAQLFEKTNSWPRAVELYHSATPEIGQEYGQRVYAALPEEQRLADAIQPYQVASAFGSGIMRPMPFASMRQGVPPRVIPQAPGLGGGVPAGRTLDSYRLTPVRMALRGP